jgi:cell division protein FtsA
VKSKHNIITALDIGTSKIVCLVADISSPQNIKVIAYNTHVASGFKDGMVTDLQQAEHSVISSIEAVEDIIENNIQKIIIGITSKDHSSMVINANVNVANHPITERDVNRVINLCIEECNKHNQEIIHYFPLAFSIDNQTGIKNPISLYGNNLSCKLHAITTPSSLILNLANCITRCQLDIEDFILSSYASTVACLTEDENDLGATVIDLGGTVSSYSVFHSNNIIHTNALKLGGNHITSDIAHGLSINFSDAERLKILYGNVLATSFEEHRVIELPPSHDKDSEPIYIKYKELCDIIRPRVEEILEAIKEKMDAADFNKILAKRIVLTGGASQLHGIKDLAATIFEAHVRIGAAKPLKGLSAEYSSPAFSSAIGLLHLVAQKHAQGNALKHNNTSNNYFKKLFKWF